MTTFERKVLRAIARMRLPLRDVDILAQSLCVHEHTVLSAIAALEHEDLVMWRYFNGIRKAGWRPTNHGRHMCEQDLHI